MIHTIDPGLEYHVAGHTNNLKEISIISYIIIILRINIQRFLLRDR